jgi:hypothetical protein
MFTIDPIAVPLARGERPTIWGLNLNVFPQGHPDLKSAYETWYNVASPILHGTGAYLYPFEHTHITASSPAPFTNPSLTSFTIAEREEYASAWLVALKATCCAKNSVGIDWPDAPFPLVFETLELKENCAIFIFRDETGGVAKIRKAITAASCHPIFSIGGRPAELLARSGFKTPNIIHSSIMRFAAPRAEGITDQDISERWANAAALWPGPITVMAEKMTFIIEAVAYQHISKGDGLIGEFLYQPA